ncbi:MAG: DUF2281 domain-containing protein [Treponema sp.]|nr:DUF2281 domain-containing protein [Treponema sp.]
MSYAMLQEELKTLPDDYIEYVSEYVELLKYKISFLGQGQFPQKAVIPGLAEGKFKYPDDINAYDDEIVDMFGNYL